MTRSLCLLLVYSTQIFPSIHKSLIVSTYLRPSVIESGLFFLGKKDGRRGHVQGVYDSKMSS